MLFLSNDDAFFLTQIAEAVRQTAVEIIGFARLQKSGLDRKSVVQGKSVDLGGRRINKKKKKKKDTQDTSTTTVTNSEIHT